jgi:tRNA-specific 2-thiouridylase
LGCELNWGKIGAVNRKKVAVGISGGVDSAVAALLLKNGSLPAGRQGYDVVGVHLYCWPPKSEVEKDGMTRDEWIKKNGCRADEDRASALKTALELEIPFKVLDFSEEYNERVIKYFYDEYQAGRTPNPDVL